MPFLDQPFVWTWLLVMCWTVYRLLASIALALIEAGNLGRRPKRVVFDFHLLGSGAVWAIFGALGWRMLAPQAGPGFAVCFGVMAGFVGFVVGLIIDLFFVLRLQHRLAVLIVAGKAPS